MFEFCGMKFRAIEGRADGMANRIFPRLPCRRRFETMPAAATSKTRRSCGRSKVEEIPMPMVQTDRLTHIGAALLRAAGASEEEAHAVAAGCVNADGIEVEDATWDKLKALAAGYKLAAELDLK
jgi:hypothetical protein